MDNDITYRNIVVIKNLSFTNFLDLPCSFNILLLFKMFKM